MSYRQLIHFGDVVRNVDEVVRDPLSCGLERFVGLEHIDPESLHIQRWGLIADGTSFTRRFRKGQVLFGKRRAYQRKVAVAEFDGLCSSDILVFEPKDDRLLPELLPFICQTDGFYEHALDTSAGSLSPRTKFKELSRYEFPLPPLDEQRRIAEILWAIDKNVFAWDIAIQALFDLLRCKVLDFINGNWPLCEIQDVGEIVTGATPSTNNNDYYDHGEILFIGPSDFNKDKYMTNSIKKITQKGLDVIRKIPIGAVMVTCIGIIGKVAIASKDCATNQQINSIICNGSCNNEYLFYLLMNHTEELIKRASCSVVPILNKSNLGRVLIPLPPIQEQNTFLIHIHQLENSMQRLEAHILAVKDFRANLLSHYFQK